MLKFLKKHIGLVLVVVVVLAILSPVDIAFAQDGTTEGQQVFEQALNTFTATLAVVLQFLSFLIWPILVLIGALMDSELIIGGGMEERILSIWTQIRNLVNLGFVIGLVGIALYNVIGVDTDGNYTIKKILPRIVLALVLVNFSFFGVKLVIDGANVLTTAMFALPNAVEQQADQVRVDELGQKICKNLTKISTGASSAQQTTGISAQVDGFSDSICTSDENLTATARQFFQRFNQNNMALTMAIQFGRITELIDTSEAVRQNPTLSNLAVNILLSAAMFVMYVAAYLALLAVLVARVFVLWMVAALSPLVALQIALPEGIGGDDLDIKDKFVQHLIAPIKIGFGMSVGFIMLSAFQQVGPDSLNFNIGQQFIAPFSGLSTVQDLIIAVLTVAVVWIVVFSAADKTAAAGITGSIKDFVSARGRNLASLPLYGQIFSTPSPAGGQGKGRASVMDVLNKVSGVEDKIKGKTAGAGVTAVASLNLDRLNKNLKDYTSLNKNETIRTLSHLTKDTAEKPNIRNNTTVNNVINMVNRADLPGSKSRDILSVLNKAKDSGDGNKRLHEVVKRDARFWSAWKSAFGETPIDDGKNTDDTPSP